MRSVMSRAAPPRLVLPVLAPLLAGCATNPPQVLTPQYQIKTFVGPIVPTAEVWPKPAWWNVFGSAELSALVAEAQANNLDLAAAASRVLAADAQVRIH